MDKLPNKSDNSSGPSDRRLRPRRRDFTQPCSGESRTRAQTGEGETGAGGKRKADDSFDENIAKRSKRYPTRAKTSEGETGAGGKGKGKAVSFDESEIDDERDAEPTPPHRTSSREKRKAVSFDESEIDDERDNKRIKHLHTSEGKTGAEEKRAEETKKILKNLDESFKIIREITQIGMIEAKKAAMDLAVKELKEWEKRVVYTIGDKRNIYITEDKKVVYTDGDDDNAAVYTIEGEDKERVVYTIGDKDEKELKKAWRVTTQDMGVQAPNIWMEKFSPEGEKNAEEYFKPFPGLGNTTFVVLVTHGFKDHLAFIKSVQERGFVGMVIFKGKTRRPEVIGHFQEEGIPVRSFGREVTENPKAIVEKLKELLKPRQPIVILDHGAYFKEIDKIKALLGDEHKILGISEATRNGVIEYTKKEEEGALSVPVISLDNQLKDAIEMQIGDSLVIGAQTTLNQANLNIHTMKKLLVIGYGPVGRAVAARLGEGTAVIDIDGSANVYASSEGHSAVRNEDRMKALGEASLVFCTSGQISLRTQDFQFLKSGAYVALGTSADSEIEDIPPEYKATQFGKDIVRYDHVDEKVGTEHHFYLIGGNVIMRDGKQKTDLGAANFVDLAPAVGPHIYTVHGMKVQALVQIIRQDTFYKITDRKDKTKLEKTVGVVDLADERIDWISKRWIRKETADQLELPARELLRQRHVRKEIDLPTFTRMNQKLRESIDNEARYASIGTSSMPDPLTLEALRRDYVLGTGKRGTDTTPMTDEAFEQAMASVWSKIIFSEERPWKNILQQRHKQAEIDHKQGKIDEGALKGLERKKKKLEASIRREWELVRMSPFVLNPFMLETLRQQYVLEQKLEIKHKTSGEITILEPPDDETFEQAMASCWKDYYDKLPSWNILQQQHDLAKIDKLGELDNLDKRKKALNDKKGEFVEGKINQEAVEQINKTVEQINKTVEQREEAFEQMKVKLQTSIKCEQKLASHELFVDTAMLEIVRRRFAQEEINKETFDRVHQALENSIERERKLASGEPRVDTSTLSMLRRKFAGTLQEPNNFTTFEQVQKLIEDSIERERKLASGEPRVNTSTLSMLRRKFAGTPLKPNDIATFERVQKLIENFIERERKLASGEPRVDTSALVTLRERFYHPWMSVPTNVSIFEKMHTFIATSITREQELASGDARVDLSALKELRRKFVSEMVFQSHDSLGRLSLVPNCDKTFDDVRQALEASIEKEQAFASEERLRNVSILGELRKQLILNLTVPTNLYRFDQVTHNTQNSKAFKLVHKVLSDSMNREQKHARKEEPMDTSALDTWRQRLVHKDILKEVIRHIENRDTPSDDELIAEIEVFKNFQETHKMLDDSLNFEGEHCTNTEFKNLLAQQRRQLVQKVIGSQAFNDTYNAIKQLALSLQPGAQSDT
ncbi:MAG TPA: hypothetical protein VGL94_16240 [Ktedonobacteraceae bacterium]